MITEQVEAWADYDFRPNWRSDWKKYPERSEALALAVANTCDALEIGDHLTTGRMIERALPGITASAKNYVAAGLQHLRRTGGIGCWRHGPKNGSTFGKPSIHWVNPLTLMVAP